MTRPILIGAVAYDPKAVTIWEAIRDLFRERPIPLDFVLFSSYEAQVEALFAGWIEVAWNTNVAWVRCKARSGGKATALAMRDTDLGFTSKLLVRSGVEAAGPKDLRGRTVALGSRDSAQAAILPAWWVEQAGLSEGKDWRALRFDLDVGKHGDTGTSELEVVKALVEGQADAGFVGESTWARLLAEGLVDRAKVKAVWTSPGYSHCNFTALPTLAPERARSFTEGLLAMDYKEPRVRHMMDLEGLKKWVAGQVEGYDSVEKAMRARGML